MEISEELRSFCYDCIYELANAFNSTLSAGLEYEDGFNVIMDRLAVSEGEKRNILSGVFYSSEVAGIPYHKLSPVNQFIVTIPSYIFYCLENKLPNDARLKEEAIILKDDPTFPRYLQEQLGVKISEEIKGALWRPKLLGLTRLGDLMYRLVHRTNIREGEQIDTVIGGLDLILRKLFMTLADIYRDKFPSDTEEKNLQRAGTILNELVLEELRGEQVAFKENNADFINKEKTRLLEIEKVRKGILSFLIAKGALYKYKNHTKANIWINGARELEPGIIIPSRLDEIIEVIEKYLSYASE